MKRWFLVQMAILAAIIVVGWLIKIQLTPVAQARMIAQPEIFVQLADGRLVPYQQGQIVKIEEPGKTMSEPKVKIEVELKAKPWHTLTAKLKRHKKLPPHRADVQQKIREIDPELADVLIRLASCESSLNPNAVGDHGHSHGLYQIFLRWHPDVTLKQARDIDFATRWTAKKIRQGEGHIWTCWAKI